MSADPLAIGAIVDPSGPLAAEHRALETAPTAPALVLQLAPTRAAEVVFVDGALPDVDRLLADFLAATGGAREIDVVRIDPSRDALAQIGDALAARADLRAVHILSHGAAGAIDFGATRLDAAALAANAQSIAQWSRAFAADGDLALYACNAGAGAAGAAFIAELARLTGADVAASDDATGAAARGGDWVLERSVGAIEARVSDGFVPGWDHVLATLTADWDTKAPGTLSETAAGSLTYASTFALGGGTVTVSVADIATVADPLGKLAPGPTVGAGLDGGFASGQNLSLDSSGYAPGEASVVTITFSGFAGGVSNVRFMMFDVDTADDGAGFVDQVVFRANGGALNPTAVVVGPAASDAAGLTAGGAAIEGTNAYSYNTFDGVNTVTGRYSLLDPIASDGNEEDNAPGNRGNGNVFVTFGQSGIASLTISYQNPRAATGQGVGLHDIAFDVADVVAANDTGAVSETGTLNVAAAGVVANDADNVPLGGESLVVSAVNGTAVAPGGTTIALASGALVTMRPDGSYTYNPNGAFATLAGGATTTDTFTYTASDQAAGTPHTANGTVTITVNGVNDAPTATNLSAGETYTEDTPRNLTDIVVGDVDSANVTVTLTLSNVAAGSLSTGTSGAVTSTYNAGTGVWTASGAIANVNALLAGLTFNPAAHFNASFTIATSVSDGTAPALTGTKAMTGIAVNDAPTATNLSAGETYNEDVALNLTDIVVSDVDSTNVTVTLTVSNPAAGSLSTATSGAVTSTYNAGTGVWTAAGAIADVNALLAGVTFTPVANASTSFTIATSVTDGVAAPVTGAKAVTGVAVNDPPTATNLSAAETYTEDTARNLVDIVVSDIDSATVTATLTLSNPAAGSLNTATSGAVTSTYNAGTGVWSASGAIANVNTLLAGLTFTPAAHFNASFTIATSVSDGVAPALTGTKSVTGTAVNDAPVLNAARTPVLAAQAEDAGAPVGAVGTLVSSLVDFALPAGQVDNVTDPDSGAALGIALTATSTASGSWWFSTNGGTTWSAVGAVANNNALLLAADANTRLYFRPNANFNGTVTNAITFRAWDQTTGTPGNKVSTTTNGGATAFSSATDTASITVTPVNDAPTATNLSAAETYTEDTARNLVDIVVTDIDSATVTATLTLSNTAAGSFNTATSGAVTSTYNAGTGVWSASGAIANVNTLLAGLTFTPAANFNASFTIATSVSDGVAPALTGIKNVTGIAVNDAPVLNAARTPVLAAQAEDAGAPVGAVGTLVSSLVDFAAPAGQVDNVTDPDSGAALGIALTAASTTSGSWWFTTNGGTTWSAVGAVANNNALLLAADASTRLYFQSNANFNGTVANAITFRAWDQTTGTAGAKVSTTTNGGATAFSSVTDTANITVTAVNDAPVLNAALTPVLGAVNEDAALPSGAVGTLVSALVNLNPPVGGGLDNVAEVDAAALTGIALTGVDATNGTWYYTTNGGTTWTTVGAVADNNALLLAANGTTRLYFRPNANWNGTVVDAITFHAWDQTAGSAGTKVNATVNGGTTAFSAATDTANITVNAVNDAPVLNAGATPVLAAANEDAGAPVGAVGTLVSALVDFNPPAGGLNNVTDVDAGAALGIALTAASTTNGSWWFTTNGGTTWTAVGAVANNNALLLAADANTRLYFRSNANFNGTVTNAITFRAWDQTTGTAGNKVSTNTNGGATAFSSATDTANVTVTAVNDAPVLNAARTPVLGAVNEDAAAPSGAVGTLVSSLVDFAAPAGQVDNVTDADAGAVLGIALTATNAANGTWWYSTNGGTTWNAVGTVADDNALLLAADASTRLYFQPGADFNGTVANAVTFRVWDRTGGTAGTKVDASVNGGASAFSAATDIAAIAVNAVNDAPVRTAGTASNLVVAEDSGTTSLGLGGLAYAAGPADESGQVLTYTVLAVPAATLGHIVLADGTTVVAAGTSYTLAQLQGMQFRAAADANGGPATFSWRARDNGGTASGGVDTLIESLTVSVTAVNDAPVRTAGTVANLTVLEDASPTLLGLGGLAYAPGPANEAAQTLTFTVTAVPAVTLGNVVLADGVTVVTAGTTYTLAQLQGMQFRTTANANGGPATFSWSVTDNGGTAGGGVDLRSESLTVSVTAVNDAPTLVAPGAVAVTEDVASPITGISVADPDGNVVVSLTLSVPSGKLAATSGGGVAVAGSGTGALALVGTTAAINAFIAGGGVVFTTDANATAPVPLTAQVNDLANAGSGGALTADATTTLGVVAVNDPPSLGPVALRIDAFQTVVLDAGNVSATDLDTPAADLVFLVAGVSNGYFELLSAPGSAVTSFTQGQVSGGLVRFVQTNALSGPGFSVFVTDGTSVAGPGVVAVSFRAAGALENPNPRRETAAPQPVLIPAPALGAEGGGLADPGLGTFLRAPAVTTPPPALNFATATATEAAPAQALARPVRNAIATVADTPAPIAFAGDVLPARIERVEFSVNPLRDEERAPLNISADAVRVTGIALSVGAVWWAARAGGLLASLVASAPAWRHLDPLPVLGDESGGGWGDPDELPEDENAGRLFDERPAPPPPEQRVPETSPA